MIDFSRIHVIRPFSVILRHFLPISSGVTLRQIEIFFRFSSQIKALFFYFNRFFVKYLLSPLIACYWSIISDYFSSILPMLNSYKKNGFCSKTVSQSRFRLCTGVFVYVLTYQMGTTLWRNRAFKKIFDQFGLRSISDLDLGTI